MSYRLCYLTAVLFSKKSLAKRKRNSPTLPHALGGQGKHFQITLWPKKKSYGELLIKLIKILHIKTASCSHRNT